MVFVDKATEAIAAHDRPGRICDADRLSALRYPQIETTVGSLPVVMIDVGLQRTSATSNRTRTSLHSGLVKP